MIWGHLKSRNTRLGPESAFKVGRLQIGLQVTHLLQLEGLFLGTWGHAGALTDAPCLLPAPRLRAAAGGICRRPPGWRGEARAQHRSDGHAACLERLCPWPEAPCVACGPGRDRGLRSWRRPSPRQPDRLSRPRLTGVGEAAHALNAPCDVRRHRGHCRRFCSPGHRFVKLQ